MHHAAIVIPLSHSLSSIGPSLFKYGLNTALDIGIKGHLI